MTDDHISITFLPTFKHYLGVITYLTFQRSLGAFFLLLFPLAGVLLLASHALSNIRTTPSDALTIVLALLMVPSILVSTSYSVFRKNKGHATTLSIDDEGVSGTGKDSTVSHKWSRITKVRKTSRFLFLHFSAKCAYFAPIDAVGEQQLERIAAMADEHGVALVGMRTA